MAGDEKSPRLILASASPARLRTLQAAGIDTAVMISGVDESAAEAAGPDDLSGILAARKAEAVAARLPAGDRDAGRGRLVLGCDSVLTLDGEILGKPADADDAIKRWQRMRGRAGVLHTGHCLIEPATGRRASAVAATTVYFADVTDDEILAYVATGEPLHVAGAFTIDGIGGPFVERVDGDPGTVIGLSLPLLRRLLRDLGIEITALWRGDTAPTRPTT